jgi:hypothetical protein
MKASMRDQKAVSETSALVEAIRVLEPRAGLSAVPRYHLADVMRRFSITEINERVAVPRLLVPDAAGGAELYIGEALTATAADAARWQALSLLWPGSQRDPDTPSLVALYCVLHLEGRSTGPEWQTTTVRDLAATPGLWVHRSLSHLLKLVEGVMDRCDPPCEDDFEEMARASELLLRARRMRDGGRYRDACEAYQQATEAAQRARDLESEARASLGCGVAFRLRGKR